MKNQGWAFFEFKSVGVFNPKRPRVETENVRYIDPRFIDAMDLFRSKMEPDIDFQKERELRFSYRELG